MRKWGKIMHQIQNFKQKNLFTSIYKFKRLKNVSFKSFKSKASTPKMKSSQFWLAHNKTIQRD